uniref:Uncharacterized protein n=1 Tax=Sphaerodactylus townsendi TaxID=933632 RepID=A0ACB8G3A9_9SAUR
MSDTWGVSTTWGVSATWVACPATRRHARPLGVSGTLKRVRYLGSVDRKFRPPGASSATWVACPLPGSCPTTWIRRVRPPGRFVWTPGRCRTPGKVSGLLEWTVRHYLELSDPPGVACRYLGAMSGRPTKMGHLGERVDPRGVSTRQGRVRPPPRWLVDHLVSGHLGRVGEVSGHLGGVSGHLGMTFSLLLLPKSPLKCTLQWEGESKNTGKMFLSMKTLWWIQGIGCLIHI